MNWGLLIPIVAISCGPIAWVLTTWIRAQHGYPLESKKGELIRRDGDLSTMRKAELLAAENERLSGQVARLEERIAVLERIATDPAERTAREIDALRGR
ncbi:hypothetical protein [Sphingomonas endolithica]|uniref:hypothetical protein n=1 Tax=Sphingomonas endolithica TaxID=2972485 RepID=UPI0021AF4F5B|nr:hypothetical protein [Sphingomonas sp. ZFBP2030]